MQTIGGVDESAFSDKPFDPSMFCWFRNCALSPFIDAALVLGLAILAVVLIWSAWRVVVNPRFARLKALLRDMSA